MPSYPIGDEPMSSAQRSRRSILQQRQQLGYIRDALKQAADLHLRVGRILSESGKKAEADECFQMAEISVLHVEILNKRLEKHEEEIANAKLPDRFGRPTLEPMERLVLTATDKQKAYRAQRAARRPEIDARYGHLAKSEDIHEEA